MADRAVSMASQAESGYESDFENIDFLLPNGMAIPLKCESRLSIGSIKEELWEKATQLPGINLLEKSNNYVFIGVKKDSVEQEFDDSTTFKELDLVWPMLEVSVPKKDRDMNRLYRILDFSYLQENVTKVVCTCCRFDEDGNELMLKLSSVDTYKMEGEVCGFSVQSLDIASENDEELRVHRKLLKKVGRMSAEKRQNWSKDKQMMFFYPPILDCNPDLPFSTAKLIMRANNEIQITAWMFEGNPTEEYSYDVTKQILTDPPLMAIENIVGKGEIAHNDAISRLQIAATDPPSKVISKIFYKKYAERYQSETEIQRRVADCCNLFVLKVCGKEEYMLKECCIHAYKYFRSCINNEVTPQLHVVLKEGLYRNIPDNTCVILQQNEEVNEISNPPADAISSWDIPHSDNYSIRVNSLPARKHDNIKLEYYIEAQVFHGKQPLCKPLRTLDKGFNQELEFDVSIQSLPRCARLCFAVCAVDKNQKFADAKVLGRLNVNVFDANGVLVTGKFSKGIWETQSLDYGNRYGPALVDGNPDRMALKLDYEIFAPSSSQVIYPSDDVIDKKIEQGVRYHSYTRKVDTFKHLDRIATYHPLQKLDTTEKDVLWTHRDFVKEYDPNLLPWLYHSVNWLERHQVFEFYRLLKTWPMKKVLLATALRLIGPDFVDTRTRTFVVRWLQYYKTSERLRLYLPQLLQAYRFDNYMKNELGYFLIHQALKDKTLGYDLFWALRCQMSKSQSKNRFAPLLEAYCLYCGADILENRANEVKAMRKYQEVSKEIKQEPNMEKHSAILQKWLADEDTKAVLENKPSTMDECIELGDLCVEDCKLLMSKMRPLWLNWENQSKLPSDFKNKKVKYIVKCGDDLRQDMLVTQLLTLMDMLWKYTENDYQLTLYNCLAMDNDLGMIEVVQDSLTVCDIQTNSEKGVLAGTISSSHIHEWLTSVLYKENREYLDMVRKFTMSCAGYCVATYLLGVGDRHSDNIMVTKDGKLFHIDFGHFMNHKKSKAGIKRERNPFVLTKEFVHVIQRGTGNSSNTERFDEFVYKCFEAFMVIRKNANIFITLLQIMMHCEIPELTENKDIEYFLNSLCLGKPDHEAAEHFIGEVFRSFRGQWSVKLDWMFHRLNKIMKTMSTS